MDEPRTEERQEGMQSKVEQMNEKMAEMNEKMTTSINQAMSAAAENLEKAANTIHKTAEFFKSRNADTIKQDATSFVKKYPAQTLVGALIFGFLFGKVISR